MDIKNIGTFELQRKSVNIQVLSVAALFVFYFAKYGWVALVPFGVITLLTGGSQNVGFGIIMFSFFAYLSSYLLVKVLKKVAVRLNLIQNELAAREASN